jgi:putative radical SAM enzyme (TIGR03279 family)
MSTPTATDTPKPPVGATKPARVVAVVSGSPAALAGVTVGDELLAINGEAVRDVIRYQVQADEAVVELEIGRGGLEQICTVEKAAGEPLGLELDAAVFDRVRTCDNHCPFCFIYQLPKGMRKSLYLKDDDYRLSFLYGNFTTLTRFTEADLERVITEGLGPLYVSIHATDPDVRTALLRNRRGATSLRWLGALLDAGVEVHGQVVVCPGVNDGAVLDDTMLGILDRFPQLTTVGVVPLGVSAHSNEVEMRPHTTAEAAAVVDCVERWQERFEAALGRRLVYAGDEYYLLAQRPFPEPAAYDGFPQHENGIGMARTFEAEVARALAGDATAGTGPKAGFFAWVDGVRPDGYRVPTPPSTPRWSESPGESPQGARVPVTLGARPSRPDPGPITILTGEYGAAVLEPLLPALEAHARVPVRLRPVPNRFFGGNIAVTGLLTGADVAEAIAAIPPAERVLLPDVVLSQGRFLDGTTVDDLPRRVDLVATDGASLVAALR